ncbi:MAG: hypothetical protein Q9195_002138 [Heterodermia aff. obscurata]
MAHGPLPKLIVVQGVDENGISYGWVDDYETEGPFPFVKDFSAAFTALNIPLEDEHNPEIQLKQDEPFATCNGKVEDPTEAIYTANYNRAGKTILSTLNYSPAHERRKELGVSSLSPEQAQTLPQAKQWSDIIWILWTHISAETDVPAGAETSDLKYIFKHHVITDSTLAIMNACSSNVDHDIDDKWPGYTFTPETEPEEFFALLGTPHDKAISPELTKWLYKNDADSQLL